MCVADISRVLIYRPLFASSSLNVSLCISLCVLQSEMSCIGNLAGVQIHIFVDVTTLMSEYFC